MNRRGFLSSVIALGASPAIVRAESMMKLWVPRNVLRPIALSYIQVGSFVTMDNSGLVKLASFGDRPTGIWDGAGIIVMPRTFELNLRTGLAVLPR